MRIRGFTLIEFLITSVIIAFVMLIAVSSQRALSHAGDKVDDFTEATAEIRYVSSMIKKDFANIYRARDKKDIVFVGGLNQGAMGDSSSVRFYSLRHKNIRENKPEAEIYEIEYFLQQDETCSDLMSRVQPNPFKQEAIGGVVSVIAENVIMFDVKYLGKDSEDWLSMWPEEQKTMPQLIEIAIVTKTDKSNKAVSEKILVAFPRLPEIKEAPANKNNPQQ